MTMLDPSDFDPDDERLSRFIDDDLDLDARDELERELAGQPALRRRLASLQAAAQWTAEEPVELPTERAAAMLLAALDAFGTSDDTLVAPDSPGELAHDGGRDGRSHAGVDGGTVIPMAPRRRRGLRWSPALVGSAAAALLLVATVAALATGGGSGDDMATESAAIASASTVGFDVERQANEAFATTDDAAAGSAMAEQAATKSGLSAAEDDAGTELGSGGDLGSFSDLGSGGDLGSFSDLESLVNAIVVGRVIAGTLPASLPPDLAPQSTTTFVPSSATAPGSALCQPGINGTASIGGRAVRWADVGADGVDDPRRIVIIDAMTCEVVLDRTI